MYFNSGGSRLREGENISKILAKYLQGRTKRILTQEGAGSQKEKQAEGEEAADAGLAEQDFCQTSLVLMK